MLVWVAVLDAVGVAVIVGVSLGVSDGVRVLVGVSVRVSVGINRTVGVGGVSGLGKYRIIPAQRNAASAIPAKIRRAYVPHPEKRDGGLR